MVTGVRRRNLRTRSTTCESIPKVKFTVYFAGHIVFLAYFTYFLANDRLSSTVVTAQDVFDEFKQRCLCSCRM